MKTRLLVTALFLTALTAGLVSPAAGAPAGELRPERPGRAHQGPYQAGPDGLWAAPDGYRPEEGVVPAGTGGPDGFGYTWDDTVPMDWIDASDGIDPGLQPSSKPYTGPIAIGFPFKFYENSYSQLYISVYGYLSFNNSRLYDGQSRIPSPELPNDVAAPHWAPVSWIDGYVRYKAGGSAPNRWFVVEWNHVVSDCCSGDAPEVYTFEVVLREGGDVWLQYKDMASGTGSYYCQSSGIEDSTGLDGLAVTNYCSRVSGWHAVRIRRPPAAARVRIWPPYQGSFTQAGASQVFQVQVRNTGELGADTYDLALSSTWPVSLLAADGVTPLTDTDADGKVDTGPVAQGATAVVVAKVAVPDDAGLGAGDQPSLTATSSRNAGVSRAAVLQAGVPSPFAQVYTDDADGAMSLALAQPAGGIVRKAAPDGTYGSYPAVTETPGGFAYVWSQWGDYDSHWGYELWYALFDSQGQQIVPATRLTDHSGASFSAYDWDTGVAATPDGRIGVLWTRELYDDNTEEYNFNVFFAVLDSTGSLLYGPANLTNNTQWGEWGEYYLPYFSYPTLAATSDNRFVLAWLREHQESGGYVDDIYYAVRNNDGYQVKPVTRFTYDTPGWSEGYWYPNLAALSGARALLSWERDSQTDIYYAVLDSAGNLVRAQANLVGDGSGSYDWSPDAVQLSGGRILVAWTGGQYPAYKIRYALLDSNYNRVFGPATLETPAAPLGSGYVSAAADLADHAVLTWMDYNYASRSHLFYALVGSSGSVITEPMIFYTAQDPNYPSVETSYTGFGSTSWKGLAPEGVDGFGAFGTTSGGPPGGSALLRIRYGNYGGTQAKNAALVVTLDPALTYLSDTSGIAPVIVGSELTWHLPDLYYYETGRFEVTVGIPAGAAYGTTYPVTLELRSDGPELDPADNLDDTAVMAARLVFLPLAQRK